MNNKHLGWLLMLAACADMVSLLAGDIKALTRWSDMFYPAFMGGVLGHIGAVLGAFIGGRLLPPDPQLGVMVVSAEKRAQLSET